MIHDIEYLIATGDSKALDAIDDHAIANADYSLQGITMKLGLQLRKQLNLKANENKNEAYKYRRLGEKLLRYVKNAPEYKDLFYKYNVHGDTHN